MSSNIILRSLFCLVAEEEATYFEIVDIPAPPNVVLEVGGILVMPDGRPLLCTRRGEVFLVNNAYGEAPEPTYQLFAQGLQEPLGMLLKDDWIYVLQRTELSRMRDSNGDDAADVFETVCDDWHISGNYHEYAFGPVLDREGNFWITLNRPFGDEPFGKVDWRGFAAKITTDGNVIPQCSGLRSPAGIGASPLGDIFYSDNQGEWCGTNKLAELTFGDFHGHPWGIESCKRTDSPLPFPGEPADGTLMPEVKKAIPSLKMPAIWFPYEKMGKSASGLLWDTTQGAFGPFIGQLFVGDQHHACVNRVFLEKVRGHWQGACFPFRYGFSSGVLRMAWGKDNSMFAGLTNRGWGSRGNREQGFQRCRWTGKIPFEILEMRARSDGFELKFTEPVSAETAEALSTYELESYTYKLHSDYGSPEVDRAQPPITAAVATADGLSVRLFVDALREGYVHELRLPGLRSKTGQPLLHPDAYYTLILRPAK